MRVSSHIAVFLALAALINTIVLNILFRDQLREQGVHFILAYQAKQQGSFYQFVQNIISIFGGLASIGFVAAIHVLFYNKMGTLVYIFYMLFNAYMIGLSKQMFQDPRPFSQDPQIEVLDWTCHTTYGMPSGHTWMSVLLYQPVISDLIGTKGPKKLLLIWLLFTGTLIGVSRMYLGSHTSDQVMFGLVCSFAFLILYRYRIRQTIYRVMTLALHGNHRKMVCFFNTLALCSIFILPFTFFEVNMKHRPFSQQKIDLLNIACNDDVTFRDLQVKAGVESSIFGIAFGIIYGLLISSLPCFSRFFQIQKNGRVTNQLYYYMVGCWNFKGRFINLLKYLIVYAAFGGVFLLAVSNVAGPKIDQFQARYIIQTLSYTIFGMSISSFIPAILFKWDTFDIEPFSDSTETKANTSEQLNKQGVNIEIICSDRHEVQPHTNDRRNP